MTTMSQNIVTVAQRVNKNVATTYKEHLEMTDPKVTIKIDIEVLDNNQIKVNGFPKNAQQAINIMNAATGTIINYFIEKARNGEVDQMGNITDSNIIKPDNLIVLPPK